jgi:hypothetical protein
VSSPTAHDHDVAHRRWRAARPDPEQPGDLGVGRVSQHAGAGEHERRLLGRDLERPEHDVGLFVLLEVDPVIRDAVAVEELADPAAVRRVARAEQLESGADLDQDRAPRHERAQDDVRQLLVVGHRVAQDVGGNLDHLAGIADDRGQLYAGAGQEVQLAEESVGAVNGDHPVLVHVALDDRDRSRLDDEEVVLVVAGPEQDLSDVDLPHRPDRTKPCALLLGQARERAVAVARLLHPDAERQGHG